MDDLFVDYLSERQGFSVIKHEAKAFVAYKINGEECFIGEIFVNKNYRKTGVCRDLIETLSKIAISSGCKVLTGNIHLEAQGANDTMKAAYKLGFKINACDRNGLLIAKNLEG